MGHYRAMHYEKKIPQNAIKNIPTRVWRGSPVSVIFYLAKIEFFEGKGRFGLRGITYADQARYS